LFFRSHPSGYRDVPDGDKLTPADVDLAKGLAFGLRFQGRKRVHDVDEIIAEIVAERLPQLDEQR
jgi:hypothetical protein